MSLSITMIGHLEKLESAFGLICSPGTELKSVPFSTVRYVNNKSRVLHYYQICEMANVKGANGFNPDIKK